MTLESLHCRVPYRIFSWGGGGNVDACLGFADLNEIPDIFKDKNRRIQL